MTNENMTPPTPTSVEALAEHCLRLSQQLEEAWSAALDKLALERSHGELGAAWRALLASLHASMEEADAKLEAAGIDTRLSEYPPSLEAVGELELDPSPERAWRQAQLGQLRAFEHLMQALAALEAPSASRRRLAAGEITRWWESGAFALVRGRARMLLRATREVQTLEAEILKESTDQLGQERSAAFEELDLAHAAWSTGDPEAALLHGYSALRRRFGPKAGHARPAAWLASLPEMRDVAPVLRVVEEAVVKLGAGGTVPLGVLIPLAHAALPIMRRAVLRPPSQTNASVST